MAPAQISMMIRLIKLQCAERHDLILAFYESADGGIIDEKAGQLVGNYLAMVDSGQMSKSCFVCRALNHLLQTEDTPTEFASLDEAEISLAAGKELVN